ncbi:hypothetical protein DXA46_25535 [Bacteroides sp. OF02-3LB]|nr:hypothetical protein DXA46_25535 [Bacteroides sp. OF02-3LB]
MAENFKTDFFTDRIGRGIQDIFQAHPLFRNPAFTGRLQGGAWLSHLKQDSNGCFCVVLVNCHSRYYYHRCK